MHRSRICILWCIGAIAVSGAGCSKAPEPRAGHWTHVETTRKDKPMVIEFRDDLKPEQVNDKPALVIVSWHFVDSDKDGNPTKTQLAAFDAFERDLVGALSKNDANVFAATITANQQHDWYFYSRAGSDAETIARDRSSRTPAQSMILAQSEPDSAAAFRKKLEDRVR